MRLGYTDDKMTDLRPSRVPRYIQPVQTVPPYTVSLVAAILLRNNHLSVSIVFLGFSCPNANSSDH